MQNLPSTDEYIRDIIDRNPVLELLMYGFVKKVVYNKIHVKKIVYKDQLIWTEEKGFEDVYEDYRKRYYENRELSAERREKLMESISIGKCNRNVGITYNDISLWGNEINEQELKEYPD